MGRFGGLFKPFTAAVQKRQASAWLATTVDGLSVVRVAQQGWYHLLHILNLQIYPLLLVRESFDEDNWKDMASYSCVAPHPRAMDMECCIFKLEGANEISHAVGFE